MDNQELTAQNKESKKSAKKKRVRIADRLLSGGIILSFIGIACFALLLFLMLVIKY